MVIGGILLNGLVFGALLRPAPVKRVYKKVISYQGISSISKGAARPKLGGHESAHTDSVTEVFPMIHDYLLWCYTEVRAPRPALILSQAWSQASHWCF